MGTVSASRSALLLSPCIRSFWSGAREYEDEFQDTTKRDRGTEFHLWMDGYLKGFSVEEEPDVGLSAKHRTTKPWVDLAVLWCKQHLFPRCELIHSEVYVAINPLTGQVHHDDAVHDRKYPDMPGYIPGTTDLVCVLNDGSLLVADWKTGGATGADKQLLTLACGLRRLYLQPDGSTRPVRLAVLYVGDDGVRPHEWEVTEAELVQHQDALAFQMQDIGVRTEPVAGIHCTQLYCKHLAYCPSHANSIDEAASEVIPAKRLVTKRRSVALSADVTDQTAGSIMERITAAERQLDFHKQRVRKHVLNGGTCESGGFTYSKRSDGFRWRAS